jgi:hypothetical protein
MTLGAYMHTMSTILFFMKLSVVTLPLGHPHAVKTTQIPAFMDDPW